MRYMSINDGRSTDLARLLKTTSVLTSDLIPGDVIVDDHNVWQVAVVNSQEVLDSDGNGITGEGLDKLAWTIVVRSVVREGMFFYG